MELLPEVEVWYGLPAIRSRLATELKKQGLSQRQIAEKLELAESAVSQYISGKRGTSELPESLDEEFLKAAQRIVKGDKQAAKQELMRLTRLLTSSRAICEIHRQHSEDVPAECSCCFE